MNKSSFENLEVWKKACRLSVEIYKELKECKDYGLKDQMCRASVSIASNIAEGSERHSNPDFIRFLRIAMGSAAELRTQLYISSEVQVISLEESRKFVSEVKSISQMLQGLINSLSSTTVNSER